MLWMFGSFGEHNDGVMPVCFLKGRAMDRMVGSFAKTPKSCVRATVVALGKVKKKVSATPRVVSLRLYLVVGHRGCCSANTNINKRDARTMPVATRTWLLS